VSRCVLGTSSDASSALTRTPHSCADRSLSFGIFYVHCGELMDRKIDTHTMMAISFLPTPPGYHIEGGRPRSGDQTNHSLKPSPPGCFDYNQHDSPPFAHRYTASIESSYDSRIAKLPCTQESPSQGSSPRVLLSGKSHRIGFQVSTMSTMTTKENESKRDTEEDHSGSCLLCCQDGWPLAFHFKPLLKANSKRQKEG
jgi:hypothetical protein